MIEEVVLESDIHKCQRLSPEMYGLIEKMVKGSYSINLQTYSSKQFGVCFTWIYLITRTHSSSELCFAENLWSEVKVCSPAVRIWTSLCLTQETWKAPRVVNTLKYLFNIAYSLCWFKISDHACKKCCFANKSGDILRLNCVKLRKWVLQKWILQYRSSVYLLYSSSFTYP